MDLLQQAELPAELQYALTRGEHDIVYFAETLLGMPLHEGQRKWLTKKKAKINILSPSNRWGKSITVAIKHIHACFYKKGIGRGNQAGWMGLEYRTANIAPGYDMAEAVFKAMKQVLSSEFPIPQPDGTVRNNSCLIGWWWLRERTINSAPFQLHFMFNAYTEFKSLGADKGDNLQGKPYGYISYDEGGRSNHLEKEVDENIIPRLFDWGGELDIVSTPDMNSASLMYHFELFQAGSDPERTDVYAQEGSIWDNTFFSREQIQDHVDAYRGKASAPQVLEGKFVFAGDLMYSVQDIKLAEDESLNNPIRYEEGHKYVIATDTAIGRDEQVHQVLDITDPECIKLVRTAAHKGASKSPQVGMADFLDLFEHYNQGDTCRHILETHNGESARFYLDMPRLVKRRTTTYGGWRPDGITATPNKKRPNQVLKADVLLSLRKVLTAHQIKIPANERELIFQLSVYQEKDDKLRTDRLMALAMGCWLATDGSIKTSQIEYVDVTW